MSIEISHIAIGRLLYQTSRDAVFWSLDFFEAYRFTNRRKTA